MKKLVFIFVAMVAMTFASCGSKTHSTANQTDSDTTVVDSVDSTAADSVSVDSIAK
jgi:hypothetical protein